MGWRFATAQSLVKNRSRYRGPFNVHNFHVSIIDNGMIDIDDDGLQMRDKQLVTTRLVVPSQRHVWIVGCQDPDSYDRL
jgi:hypothetical protein